MSSSSTEKEQRAEHFELLLEVGRLLSSKLDLDELLTAVMQLAARVVDAETASLLLVDPATDELYFHVALGLDPELAKLRLKMGQGIAGTVAQSAKPLIINDVRKDPRWSSKMDEDSGFVTRSILAAPIVLRGQCIGVVEAINHIGGDFSLTDLRVFEAFASQSAVAIENARLFSSLRAEKSKLDRLLNEMNDAALLTDGAGGILVANRAARRILGGDEEPRRIEVAIAGLELKPPLEEIMASEEPFVEFEAVREEPKRLVLAGTASPIRGGDGAVQGRVIVFRDVTEEKREEGLKRNFLSLISHKLKTPLSSITGYSQLLLDDSKKKEAEPFQVNALGTILGQGQKLSGLVDKLLNYTVLEDIGAADIARQDFVLEETLQSAVEALEPFLLERKASVRVEAPGGTVAYGDPVLVRDVVKNLIENAVKFVSGRKPEAVLSCRRAGDAVEILIADNGPGIPPEESEKIFGKFYQIDASFTGQIEGWGLGLSFAREVIRRLGGSIRVESKVGAGSTFILSLPVPPA